jgi:protein-S-isoprenylcysteine O-methyltransferase Ste14
VILGRAYFALQALAGATWWIAVALFPFVRSATLGSLSAPAVAVADVPLFVLASAAAALGLRRAAWVAATWTCIVTAALAAYATLTGEAGWGVLLMAGAAGASVAALSLVVLGHVPTRWLLVGPFAFRPATPRTSARPHVLATGVQILVFWGFFLAVVPLVLRFLEHRWGVSLTVPPVVDLVGVVALVLASGLGIWSAVAMSTTGDGTPLPAAMANRLVIAGPYRWVRNPMAVSGIVQGVAVGLVLSSWLVVVYALLGSMLWNFAIRPHEELDLELRFGDPYRRYRDSVRCWVPRIVRARGAFASVS